jgi:hypothetical protein
MAMASNPVIIFGAGATKACWGPLTNEILYDIFRSGAVPDTGNLIHVLNEFLVRSFHVPEEIPKRNIAHYPSLPLLLSLIDVSIDKKQPLGGWGDVDKLMHVREALEYGIFALLEHQLQNLKANSYFDLFEMLVELPHGPNVISLNYDIIADNSMMMLSLVRNMGEKQYVPDYGIDIATEIYRQSPKLGTLLKLHDSLNWFYCPGCHRLELGISPTSHLFFKVRETLWKASPLEKRYGSEAAKCTECETSVRPVLITPTHLKDYRNPHIAQVWYHAERLLRAADRAIFVGYSLPEDDVEVVYLLKRGLETLSKNAPEMITVVEYDTQNRDITTHPTGLRYRSLFGDRIDWHTEGFAEWINAHREKQHNPMDGRLP